MVDCTISYKLIPRSCFCFGWKSIIYRFERIPILESITFSKYTDKAHLENLKCIQLNLAFIQRHQFGFIWRTLKQG